MLHSFARKIDQELFEKLHFVALAVSKDPTSEILQHIYSNDGNIVATDGRRCHIFESTVLPDGFYQVIERTKTKLQLLKSDTPMDFPDYKRVIPVAKNMVEFTGTLDAQRLAQVIRSRTSGAFDIGYFKDLLTHDLVNQFSVVEDPYKPLLVVGQGIKAVLMPMHTD